MDILFYISIIKIWYNRLFQRELDFYKILYRNIKVNNDCPKIIDVIPEKLCLPERKKFYMESEILAGINLKAAF